MWNWSYPHGTSLIESVLEDVLIFIVNVSKFVKAMLRDMIEEHLYLVGEGVIPSQINGDKENQMQHSQTCK